MDTVQDLAERWVALSTEERNRSAAAWRRRVTLDPYSAWKPWRSAWSAVGAARRHDFWQAETAAWLVAGRYARSGRTDRLVGWPGTWIPVTQALLALVGGHRVPAGERWHLLAPLAEAVPEIADQTELRLGDVGVPTVDAVWRRLQAAHPRDPAAACADLREFLDANETIQRVRR